MISPLDALHQAYHTKRQKELIHKERACSQVMVRVKETAHTVVDKGFFLVDYRQPKLSINKKLIRVVSYCVILNMAVNIKDLYGNSGNRLKKIKYSLEFSIKKRFTLFVWCFLLSCGYDFFQPLFSAPVRNH